MVFFFIFVSTDGQVVFASEASGMAAQLQRVKGETTSRGEEQGEIESQDDSSPAAVSGMAIQLLRVKSETVEEISISEPEIERITISSEDTESKDIETDKQINAANIGSEEKKNDSSLDGCHAGFVSGWGMIAVVSLTLLRRNKKAP